MSNARRLVGNAVLILLAVGGVGAAQLDEYGVKSAFVYNIVQFAEWPTDRLTDGAPLVICVFNDSPITQRLNPLRGQSVKNHALRVRTAASLSDLAACHVVFLPARETHRLQEIAVRYPAGGLLLVTEDQETTHTEAAVNLVVANNRIAFEINLDVAREQRVGLSSKLIRLARRVIGTGVATSHDPATLQWLRGSQGND